MVGLKKHKQNSQKKIINSTDNFRIYMLKYLYVSYTISKAMTVRHAWGSKTESGKVFMSFINLLLYIKLSKPWHRIKFECIISFLCFIFLRWQWPIEKDNNYYYVVLENIISAQWIDVSSLAH